MKDYSVLNGMIENQKSELRTAYDKGYNQGVKDFDLILATSKKEEEGYNRGLEDAWACCKRFLNSDDKVCDKIFGISGWADFLDQSPSDAIEKFKEYDSKHYDLPKNEEINIGDEIICNGVNIKAVVFKILDNTHYKCFSLEHGVTTEEGVVKTGRRFPEMVELIERMKNE